MPLAKITTAASPALATCVAISRKTLKIYVYIRHRAFSAGRDQFCSQVGFGNGFSRATYSKGSSLLVSMFFLIFSPSFFHTCTPQILPKVPQHLPQNLGKFCTDTPSQNGSLYADPFLNFYCFWEGASLQNIWDFLYQNYVLVWPTTAQTFTQNLKQ